jgi:hypothetical protein
MLPGIGPTDTQTIPEHPGPKMQLVHHSVRNTPLDSTAAMETPPKESDPLFCKNTGSLLMRMKIRSKDTTREAPGLRRGLWIFSGDWAGSAQRKNGDALNTHISFADAILTISKASLVVVSLIEFERMGRN